MAPVVIQHRWSYGAGGHTAPVVIRRRWSYGAGGQCYLGAKLDQTLLSSVLGFVMVVSFCFLEDNFF